MVMVLRFLGMVAFVSDWLSRVSVRGLPGNWVVVGFLLLGCGASSEAWKDAHQNGTRPQTLTVGRFATLATGHYAHWYVRVSGVVMPRLRLSVKKKVTDTPAYDLVAFLDERQREGIWLKVNPGDYAGGRSFRADIEGVMGRASSDFDTNLIQGFPRLGGAIMHREAWLEAGRKPPTALWSAFSFGACLTMMALLIGASLARNIVFWPHTASGIAPRIFAPDQNIPVRISGRLRASAKRTRRVLNEPAHTFRCETGEMAVSALSDPTREPGSRAQPLAPGMWQVVLGGERRVQSGLLFHGLRLYPALRIAHCDPLDNNRPLTTIVACEDEATRAALHERLERSSISN